MTNAELIRIRQANQQIIHPAVTSAEQLVDWMMAIQAQEYAMAKWAIGLRVPGSTDDAIEQAFNSGRILRTHVLRPTWHFVTPSQIRWLLQLTAPQVRKVNAFTYREQSLDARTFRKSNDLIGNLLQNNNFMERTEIQAALHRKRIVAAGIRLSALMMEAELEGIICSGPRKRNQFTYALLDDRAPTTSMIEKTAALTRLAEQYFVSRGPATRRDLAAWSGLSMKDVETGVRNMERKFERVMIGGQEYIFQPPPGTHRQTARSFLLPDYDEYGMSYRDRSAILPRQLDLSVFKNENPFFNRMIVIDGKIAGTWKRTITRREVEVQTALFKPLTRAGQAKLDAAIRQFRKFAKHS